MSNIAYVYIAFCTSCICMQSMYILFDFVSPAFLSVFTSRMEIGSTSLTKEFERAIQLRVFLLQTLLLPSSIAVVETRQRDIVEDFDQVECIKKFINIATLLSLATTSTPIETWRGY